MPPHVRCRLHIRFLVLAALPLVTCTWALPVAADGASDENLSGGNCLLQQSQQLASQQLAVAEEVLLGSAGGRSGEDARRAEGGTAAEQVDTQVSTSAVPGLRSKAIFLLSTTVALVALIVMHEIRVAASGRAAAETSSAWVFQALGLMYVFLVTVDVFVLVPFSYDLAIELNFSGSLSGVFIGCMEPGFILGALLARYVAQGWYQARVRAWTIWMLVGISLCDLSLAGVLQHGGVPESLCLTLLITLRVAAGFGFGVAALSHWMAVHLTTPEDQTAFAFAYAMARNLGVCTAPVLPLALRAFMDASGNGGAGGTTARTDVASTMGFMSIVWMTLALLVALRTPTELNVVKRSEPLEGSATEASERLATRRSLVLLGLLVAGQRKCSVTGIELATTLFLERQYGWHRDAVGFGLGIIGVSTIGVCVLGIAARALGHAPGTRMLVVSAVAALVSTYPLFDITGPLSGPFPILVADAFVYSAGYFMQGICDGIAVNAAIPGETIYSMEDYQFLKRICTCVASLVASTGTRVVILGYGRDAYASLQVGLCLVGWLAAMRMASLVSYVRKDGSCAS